MSFGGLAVLLPAGGRGPVGNGFQCPAGRYRTQGCGGGQFRDRTADFWIQFGTPSTSARRSGGNPPAGRWSPFDSRIWVNGEPIAPPEWNNPGPLGPRPVEREIAFTNESYHFRPPTRVHLKKGWNQVLIRAPMGRAEGYRGGKWMFTCVPITWDGERARELGGIVFSATPPSVASDD